MTNNQPDEEFEDEFVHTYAEVLAFQENTIASRVLDRARREVEVIRAVNRMEGMDYQDEVDAEDERRMVEVRREWAAEYEARKAAGLGEPPEDPNNPVPW